MRNYFLCIFGRCSNMTESQFHPMFRWWGIKAPVGFKDETQEESNDVTDMLCMGGEL